ncbi:MAG: dephospho-CoA kinase [Bacteroidota bacterium]|nr:dephospho-CoA kinase [Bacteroidota bacterium]
MNCIKVGITGGIGSGKSTICKIFSCLNVPVFSSDIVSKSILESDKIARQQIKIAFGDNSYLESGLINKKYLGELVFSNKEKLKVLESISHPAVNRAFQQWLIEIPENTNYILKEAAILIETSKYKELDKLIVVTSPISLRIERVLKRENISEQQIIDRIKMQLSDEEKLKFADYSITNDVKSRIIDQVIRIHHSILEL